MFLSHCQYIILLEFSQIQYRCHYEMLKLYSVKLGSYNNSKYVIRGFLICILRYYS